MHRTAFLLSLRASLLAAAGLGAFAACGDDDDDGGLQAGAGTGGTAGASGSGAGGGGPAGTGGGTGAGGGTGTGGGAGAGGALCQSPTAIVNETGAATGFETCADGAIRRVAVVAPDPALGVKACAGTETSLACQTDAECVEKPNGKCASLRSVGLGGEVISCGCVYPCASDAECGAGSVCVASAVEPSLGRGAFCAPAACATGQDCPSGECGLSAFDNGCGMEVQLACRSAADTCHGNAECTQPGFETCALPSFNATNWQCSGTGCAIGRPLLVEGRAQTARPAERSDWSARGPGPAVDGLDAELREALARHWLEIAALEHASVASFARFTLELLALGAPPALVADAQRAGLDEIAHAEIAYSLASAYAGRRLGPGPLDLGGISLTVDRRKALRALVHEACVGETLGVAEAHALAAAADDPALGRIHARIAADEQRHAELAWRTLAWLLEGASDDDLCFASACFDEAVAAAQGDPPARDRVARGQGLLSASELGALRRQALREVIAPCAEALCGRPLSATQA
ncbi:MAG TPA: ferritin-like domain-containing protein [Polyangiaceae bacterium]|nr:ferritin-like domain-containing protein [Polyangiaceae bacterium]